MATIHSKEEWCVIGISVLLLMQVSPQCCNYHKLLVLQIMGLHWHNHQSKRLSLLTVVGSVKVVGFLLVLWYSGFLNSTGN
jgi:hypothetical protein